MRQETNPGYSSPHIPLPSGPSQSDFDKLEAKVSDIRDAVVTAVGKDGTNGKLSRVRKDLTELREAFAGAKKTLVGAVITLVLGTGASFYQDCVSQKEANVRIDARVEAIEKHIDRQDHHEYRHK